MKIIAAVIGVPESRRDGREPQQRQRDGRERPVHSAQLASPERTGASSKGMTTRPVRPIPPRDDAAAPRSPAEHSPMDADRRLQAVFHYVDRPAAMGDLRRRPPRRSSAALAAAAAARGGPVRRRRQVMAGS